MNDKRSQRHHVPMLGVCVHTASVTHVLATIQEAIVRHQHILITYINVYALNLAYTTPWFRAFLNQSAIAFCDGFGVKWGARLLGHHLPHRYTPPDWFDDLATMARDNGFTLYFLGAKPGIAASVATTLAERMPGVRVVGTHHGYFNKTPGHPENEAVIAAINACQPHIVLIGFGMPLQERWLNENWHRIDANVALTVGAMFDYLAGEVKRGPRWMTDHGLEWLARLIIEPQRLWKRYLVGNPLFLFRIIKQRLGFVRFDE